MFKKCLLFVFVIMFVFSGCGNSEEWNSGPTSQYEEPQDFVSRGGISKSPMWELQQRITPAVRAEDFGTSVFMTPDAKYIIVGSVGLRGAGAVYIYKKTGASWEEQKELTPSKEETEQ